MQKYNEIQFTKNKMDSNYQKMKNYPPSQKNKTTRTAMKKRTMGPN